MLLILNDAPLPEQFETNVELYLPKQQFTRAAKMPCPFEVIERDGRRTIGRVGDYVVLDENDVPTRMTAGEFDAHYDKF